MSPLEVLVVGGSGVVGEQVLARLARSDLPLGVVRVYGSANRSGRVDEVSYGGETLPVEPITNLEVGAADVVLLCAPAAASTRLAVGLSRGDALVVDIGNTSAGETEAPLFHPALGLGFPPEVESLVRTPSAPGWLLTLFVAPLIDLGLTHVSGLVALPATRHGRGAMEELGQQVIASLTSQDPPRRVFPDGLAFDVLPEDTPPEEWSAAERLAAEEVFALTGFEANRIAITLGTFPWFAGVVASLHLRGVPFEGAEEALHGAAGLKGLSASARLRPRALAGKEVVAWGRLRPDPDGDGVHLWVVADNLIGAGAAAAVGAVEAAIAAGRLPRGKR